MTNNDDGMTYYYFSNNIGSTIMLTDKNGDKIASYLYYPYGETWVKEGDADIDRLFTGEPFDKETGLYYLTNRYYDPGTGIFLRPDPAMSGMNHYAYTSGNPINYVDPTGLEEVTGNQAEDIPPVTNDTQREFKVESAIATIKTLDTVVNGDETIIKVICTEAGLTKAETAKVIGAYRVGQLVVGGAGIIKKLPKAIKASGKILAKLAKSDTFKVLAKNLASNKGFALIGKGSRNVSATRKLWQIKRYDKVGRHGKFGKVFRDPKTKLWWSKDQAGHGGSAWKVFKESKNGKGLEFYHDADKYGNFITGKHKGSVGKFISWKELNF